MAAAPLLVARIRLKKTSRVFISAIHSLLELRICVASIRYHSASICRTSHHISQLHASRLSSLLPLPVSAALPSRFLRPAVGPSAFISASLRALQAHSLYSVRFSRVPAPLGALP